MEGVEGKFVGLYFTADWCGPCKPFYPGIDPVSGTPTPGKFAFIMMSLDHSREDQLAYLKKSAMNAPAVVFDDPVTNRLMQQRGFREIPAPSRVWTGRPLTDSNRDGTTESPDHGGAATGRWRFRKATGNIPAGKPWSKPIAAGVDDWKERRDAAVAEIFERLPENAAYCRRPQQTLPRARRQRAAAQTHE